MGRRGSHGGWAVAVLVALSAAAPPRAEACPFCGTVAEPLARRRDSAGLVCVAEAEAPALRGVDGLLSGTFRILQPLKRADPAAPVPRTAQARVAAPIVGTAILFASADDPPRYSAVAADEAVIAHVMAAPTAERAPEERLAWYAARLEHPDAVIAEDAFAEFGLAPFPAVRASAAALAGRPLAEWLFDPAIDQRRRGFYGLALGVVAASGLPEGRPATSAPLRKALATAAGDFRAGADGVMGGILVADGPDGLDWLVARATPDRPVDQRQLLAALRFAHEFLGDSIPPSAVVSATARLADSAAVAADAIVDLARYEAWEEVERVAGWWPRADDDPLIRRAVAGYLLACPLAAAARHRARLEAEDGEAFARARAAAALPPGQ